MSAAEAKEYGLIDDVLHEEEKKPDEQDKDKDETKDSTDSQEGK